MTPEEIFTGLKGLGYPVAYRKFGEGEVPNAPYIVWYFNGTEDFPADGIAYQSIHDFNIELYAEKKDFEAEKKIEQWLTEQGIFFDYEEFYIESENYIETLYMSQI